MNNYFSLTIEEQRQVLQAAEGRIGLPAQAIEKDLWVKDGDKVNAFHGANDAIGTLVLQFTNEHDLENVLRLQSQWIKVKVI